MTGSDHGQTGTQSSNTATNTAISPGGEVHSGQVAKDITKPPGESAQSNEPVVEAAVKPKAPAVDAPAPAAIETEPVQPPAEAAGKLSPPEADVATQQSHQQSTAHPPSPAVINTANQPSQPAADPVVNLQPAVEPVADRDSVPSQRESVDHLELQTESADSSSDISSDKLRTSAQHDDQHSVSDVGRSRSNSESNSVPVADDDVAKQHLPGEHTEQPSEQLTEPEPSDRDDSQQRNTNADEFPRESDDSVDKEQSQHTDESDHLANVDVILPASEESEKSSEQLTPSTNEPASDLHDSQQRKIDTTDVHAEPDDLSDELATSGNVQMHLKEAEHEGKAEAVADEQTSAAGDKGSVGGYFAWAAVDAWLMTCIDSVSRKCVIMHCIQYHGDLESTLSLYLYLHFNGHFPGGPGLASSRMSPFWIGATDDGGGGNNWSYKTCSAPVRMSPPTNQHPVFLQARSPSCCPTNGVKALNRKSRVYCLYLNSHCLCVLVHQHLFAKLLPAGCREAANCRY